MTTTPLNFLAFFTAKPGQADALEAVLLDLVAPTRAEAECVNYDLHRFRDDPARYVLYEGWTSQAALDAHMRTPHFIAAGPKLVAACDPAPDGRPFAADPVIMVSDRA